MRMSYPQTVLASEGRRGVSDNVSYLERMAVASACDLLCRDTLARNASAIRSSALAFDDAESSAP